MKAQHVKRERALIGFGLAIAMGMVLVAATFGALSAAQPAYAHAANPQGERAAARLAPEAETISISKSAHTSSGDNGVVFNGQPITYTIFITNNSASNAATNILVLDVLPPSALDNINCLSACQPIFVEKQIPEPLGDTILVTVTTQLSWTVASLAPHASTQLVFNGRVEGQTDGTVFKNRAFATYNLGGNTGAVSTPDVLTTVRAQIGQTGQPSLANAPTWFSADLGGTLSQDWGDFNGDGQLDLVLGSSLGVSVYINQNGQLKPYWNNFSSNLRAYGVRWADFNHDGKLEIVAVGDSLDNSAVTSGTNYIYGQTPSGFASTGSFISDYQMVRVAVGRFTNSGNIDIIASTNTLNAACPVRLFRNNGSGAFSGPGDCVSTAATAALGPGDYDNNGSLDLALGVFPNTIEILRNNGNGVFTTTAPVIVDNNVPFLPYDFAWGDYDNNGLLDLAAAFPLQKEARVYRNLGNNVFDSPMSPFHTTKFLSPLSVTWGDFNGDGALDLAVADDTPKVYLNQQGTLDQSDPLAASTVSGQVWSLRAEQVDSTADLQLSLSDRDAASLLFDSFGSHLASNITQVNANSQQASSLATGDTDDNGTIDMVFGAAPLPVQGSEIDYNTNGAFPTQLELPSGPGPQTVALGDVNGDGLLDVAVGTAVEAQLYLSGQTVTAWTASAPNGPNHVVALCDVNSDGRLDLLVGSNGGGVAVYLNQGGALSTDPTFTTSETGNVKAIACGDVRHNHYSDFAVAFDNQPVQLYGNDFNGTFTSIWNSGTHSHTTSLAWGDFNLDGYADLAVGNRGQGTQIFENYSGHLQNHAVWSSPTQWNTTAIAWGDWNNDGQIDLAIGNDGQPAQVYGNLNSTPGQPRLFWLWTAADSFATTGIAWGDFEGTGHLDLGLSQSGVCCNGFYRNGSVTASHLSSNFLPTLSLPVNPTYLYVPRPGTTADGYANSASEILGGPSQPTVTVSYTLYDGNGTRSANTPNAPGNTIIKTNFEYSLDGGSHWLTATAAAGSPSPITSTSRLGQTGSFVWDIVKDKAVSDDARFRVRVVPFIPVGPVENASAVAVSPPFRVHGVTCVWPQNPTITVSQNPITPTVAAGFFGSVSTGTGALTYTWSFGDSPFTFLGQALQHTYVANGTYTVTLTVTGQPCPQNRPVVVNQVVQVGGNQQALPNVIFLPMVNNGQVTSSAPDGSSSLNTIHSVPTGYSRPAPAGSSKVQAAPQAQPASPQPAVLPSLLPAVSPVQMTTSTIGINNEPSVNGDGTRLAYWSTADPTGNNPDGNIELYVMISDTGGLTVTQITSSTGSILGGFNLSPSIDRAGARVAFFSDRDLVGLNPDFNFEIFYYDVNTGVLTQLTQTTRGFNILPSISGDGQFIAFASDRDLVPGSNPDGNTEIFRAQIGAGGAVTFTQVTHTSGGVNDQPHINDDGTRIAFVSDHNLDSNNGDNNREVFLATIGGTVTFKQISNTTSGNTGEPVIDGDGRRVAFVSNRIASNLHEIYYADVDGGGTLTVTRVTTSAVELGIDQPSISDDGTRIAFISPNNGMVRVFDTQVGAELTATVGAALNPALSGDGTVVAYGLNKQLYTLAYRLAHLTVTKTVPPGLISQDQLFTYTVVVNNGGPSPATDIILTDTLGSIPGAKPGWLLNGYAITAGGNCSTVTGTPIICNIPSLSAHNAVTLSVGITPTTYGALRNVAVVTTVTPQYSPTPDAILTVAIQPLPVGAVNLELTGPVTGTAHLNIDFLAVVSPITASVPLTYDWEATNQASRVFTSTLFTDTESYSWDPGGVQMVTVTVSNAASNVVSATKTITIFNPAPKLTSMSPTTATFNDPTFTLVLTGTGFVANSSVLWNNVPLAANEVTSATLQATVPFTDLTSVGTYTVAVFNPTPGGGLSTSLPFTVEYAAPSLSSISPITAATGGLTFTMSLNGSGFINGASVYFDSQPALPANFVTSSLLTAQVPFSYLLTAGTVNITVTNPSPSVGPSNSKPFTIVNPTLTLVVNPNVVTVGGTATLTATISDLQANSRVITLTSSNPLIASLPSSVVLPAQTSSVSVTVQGNSLGGTATLTGTLPTSIGGDSGTTQITVSNPTPNITQVSPVTTTAGGVTFTLTLTGSNFVSGASLYWDGQAPLVLSGSGSQVSALIPANYFASPGTVPLTVTNPSPSNGASTVFNYTVVSPTITLTPSNVSLSFFDSATLTATISAPQAFDRIITIDSSTGRVQAPSSVILPAQSQTITFTITSSRGSVSGATVTATLPVAQGGQSDTTMVTVSNPGPSLTTVSPNPITVTVPVTLDIIGDNFVSNSTVRFAGQTLTQTVVATTEITAVVPADLYPIAGDYVLTITNPPPGGGFVTTTVTAVNPVPQITATLPTTATAGSPFFLFVGGNGFISGTSTIQWNGSPRTTLFGSSSVLAVLITGTDIASPDIIAVTVVNSGPGGGVSNSWPFTITTSQPAISAISPSTLQTGGAPFTLVVTGTGFVTSPDPSKLSTVQINGSPVTTIFGSSTSLSATVNPNADLPFASVYTVTVLNPDSPGPDKLSNGALLTVTNPAPTVITMTPTLGNVGQNTTLIVTGTNFVSRDSIVLFNGVAVSTTFNSPVQLTASLSSTLLTSAGSFPVTVKTNGPGGGTASPALSFEVDNIGATLTDLAPDTKNPGSNTFTLVVTGTDFVSGASLEWNSVTQTVTLATTLITGTTRATAPIPSTLLKFGGYYTITLRNPAPPAGGIESLNFLTVTVPNPQPVISTIGPNNTVAGTGGLTVFISATNHSFTTGVTALWNGLPRTTNFTDRDHIQMILNDTDVLTVGVNLVTVQNPDPSLGVSTSKNFTVNAPTVSLTPAGTTNITLPANGILTATISDIQADDTVISLTSSNPSVVSVPATVLLNGGDQDQSFALTTHNISGTATITATLPDNLGGDISNVVTVHVVDAPITGLSAANSGPTTLGQTTLFTASISGGTNVSYTWNLGDSSAVTALSTSNLTSYTYGGTAGMVYTAVVTATNSIGTKVMTTTVVTINNLVPTISNMSPVSLTHGVTTSVTLTGTNFIAGATVKLQPHGGGATVTYTAGPLTSTQITVTVNGTDIPSAGSYDIWVENPTPPAADDSNHWVFSAS